MQAYVTPPGLVTFSPVRRILMPTLRSKPSDILEDEEEAAEEEVETCDVHVEVGSFFAVLGDSSDGYYIVKCVASSVTNFSGTYLVSTAETVQNKLAFKETRNRDSFHKNCVISELNAVREFSQGVIRFLFSKDSMDNVLATVAELSCI